jgi:hypothetical protein
MVYCIPPLRQNKVARMGHRAIKPTGVAELTVGPAGGFRHARLELKYDGTHQTVELYNGAFWQECVQPIVKQSGCTILITRLPSKKEIKASK